MRKKIAMRWRKEALRRGAVITNEGKVLTKTERVLYKLRKKDVGFGLTATCNGWEYHVAGKDVLCAYRLLVQAIDDDEVSILCKHGTVD